MEENIKSLVSDGTITQSQADKILEALTQNPGGFGGQRRSGGNQQTDGQNGQQNGQGNSSQNGNQNDNQNGNQNWQRNNNDGQNGQRNSALSKLVTDGVITQAQADAVMEKIKGNFTRPQQAPQNSQSKQSS
jgi:competence protein ComGC